MRSCRVGAGTVGTGEGVWASPLPVGAVERLAGSVVAIVNGGLQAGRRQTRIANKRVDGLGSRNVAVAVRCYMWV